MLVEQDVQLDRVAVQPVLSSSRTSSENMGGQRLERLSNREALLARCRTCALAGHWADLERIASTSAATYPDESSFYSQWAWAIHRQGKTVEALHIVDRVAHRFPNSVSVAYAQACLNGALQRHTPARQWLDAAIDRASNPDKVKLRSLVQAELQCLWTDEAGREES